MMIMRLLMQINSQNQKGDQVKVNRNVMLLAALLSGATVTVSAQVDTSKVDTVQTVKKPKKLKLTKAQLKKLREVHKELRKRFKATEPNFNKWLKMFIERNYNN